MKITKKTAGSALTIALSGRLDTTTSPELEREIKSDISQVTELSFDFTELEYISSAGLRVLLTAQKIMNKQGRMVIRHVSEAVLEVFDITGFSDILTIE
ncbi:MAG: STAS domain-containing protein [Faecousia sp.]